MGYTRHHAIIVTSYRPDVIDSAHSKATAIFGIVSAILKSRHEVYYSFFIPPDGGNDGGEWSDGGDALRDQFVDWLNGQRFEDGSNPLAWVEVQYHDDEGVNKVTRHEALFWSDEITGDNPITMNSE